MLRAVVALVVALVVAELPGPAAAAPVEDFDAPAQVLRVGCYVEDLDVRFRRRFRPRPSPSVEFRYRSRRGPLRSLLFGRRDVEFYYRSAPPWWYYR